MTKIQRMSNQLVTAHTIQARSTEKRRRSALLKYGQKRQQASSTRQSGARVSKHCHTRAAIQKMIPGREGSQSSASRQLHVATWLALYGYLLEYPVSDLPGVRRVEPLASFLTSLLLTFGRQMSTLAYILIIVDNSSSKLQLITKKLWSRRSQEVLRICPG